MARKASVESPMDITEDKRKNEVELTAIKRAMRNTRWWKVFITVFMIAGIVAPVISIHAISTLQDMGSMLSAKYKEISVDKPGKQAALASVNKWLDTNKGPFRYGTTNLLWDSATKVGSSDEDTGTGKEHTDWWSHQFSLTDLSDGSTPRRNPAHFMEEQRGHRRGRANSAAVESKRRWWSPILYAIRILSHRPGVQLPERRQRLGESLHRERQQRVHRAGRGIRTASTPTSQQPSEHSKT